MIINVNNKEYVIETKIYYSPKRFSEGKKQIAYYCRSLIEIIDGIEIMTCIVRYDE